MYIVFEGVDGAGKSTQIEPVKKLLEEKLREVYKYNRPFLERMEILTVAEKEIENITNPDDDIEYVLRFALQRRILSYHMNITPNRKTPIVISDRSFYSSMAYQSNYLTGNVRSEYIRTVNKFMPEPNMIFFFDNGIPHESSLYFTYRKYFEVLPLSTVYVNTKKYNVEEVTEYIVSKIIAYMEDKDNILF